MADTGKTGFEQYDLIPLKHMLRDSNPGRLREVSRHWSSVHEELQQAAQDLQKAVEHASQNWQGAAADGFAQRAGQLQTKMTNTAEYARTTSDAMVSAAKALDSAKTAMANITVPSSLDSGWKDVTDGFGHSDAQFKADLAGGMERITAVNKNYGSLSAMEISHQYAIGTMEYLAPKYIEAASHIVPPDGGRDTWSVYPPPPSNPTPPGGIPSDPMPQPRDPGSTGGNPSGHQSNYVNPHGPNHPGTPGSPVDITTLPNQPATGPNSAGLPSGPSTGIDSWVPPTPTTPAAGTGLGGPGGVGPTVGIGGGGGGVSAGGIGNVPIGGAFLGGPGGSGAGGLGAGPHATGGLGGGKGSVGGKSAGPARRSGGTAGSARSGKASGRAFTEGGTGLGRNRQGQGGMAGAQGAHGNKKERKDGKRPDYLVEDEETWQTNDPVNPPVIE